MKIEARLLIEVTDQDIEDILTVAFDEGIISWGEMDPEMPYEEAAKVLLSGGEIGIRGDAGEEWLMDLGDLKDGIKAFMEDPDNHGVTEDEEGRLALNTEAIEADAADKIIQYALFGEVRA